MSDENRSEPEETEPELLISKLPDHPPPPPAGEADLITDAEDPDLDIKTLIEERGEE